jgi:hypothetical protein
MIDRRMHGLAILAAIGIAACSTPATTAIPFGRLETVQLYTLTNTHGLVARITNYGAIVTELHVPDRAGTPNSRSRGSTTRSTPTTSPITCTVVEQAGTR